MARTRNQFITRLAFATALAILAAELFVLVTTARADTSSLSGVDVSYSSYPRQVNSTLNNDCTDIMLMAINSNPTAVTVTMRVELDSRQNGNRIMSRLLQGSIGANAIAEWQATAEAMSTFCGYDANSYIAQITVLEVFPATKTTRFALFRDDGR